MLKGIGEESPITRELPNGKYIILQARNELDNWSPVPILAFEVEYGNFSIMSISGDRDFATLASEVWHLQFTDKKITTLRKIKKLRKEISRIEKDVTRRLSYSSRYKKK